jgi:ribonuclease HII
MPDFALEIEAGGIVAGIDEAGRGPWAGPVVAAAALLDRDALGQDLVTGLDDSKALTPMKRDTLFDALMVSAAAVTGVGMASVEEIDAVNILQATHLAMARALDQLGVPVGLALVDGNRAPPLPCPVRTVVKGDSRSLSIAAASIVAKVTRDRLMGNLAEQFPGYGWETNQGYGTPAHRHALDRLGVTLHHRKSYAPVRVVLEKT